MSLSTFLSKFPTCKRTQALGILAVVSAPLIFSGCSKSEPEKTETKAEPAAERRAAGEGGPGRGGPGAANRREVDPIPVQIAEVTRGPISATLSFNSTLETESVVDIYPRINGQVDQLLVEEGDFVTAGTPLLKIDDRELRVDADEAQVTLEREKADFTRTEGLFQRGLVNQQEYENDRFALSQAQLRADRARIRYDYATVVAPFDGVISEREVQIGARVATGTKLFSFVSLQDMVAKVFVPGRYLTEIAVDQSAEITSEFLPDKAYAAWVKRISPIIDPASGTFKVTVGVREPGAAIVPGLFVRASITTEERPEALLIPKSAVVYEGGSQYVFTVRRDRAMRLALDAGFENPTHIEVRSGLQEGDEVVVLGQSGLKDRSPVKIVDPVMPTEDDESDADEVE
ncbi:MAG: efflux RND transporter periplasmic adaptor subunit [Synoicihabitans sp.]